MFVVVVMSLRVLGIRARHRGGNDWPWVGHFGLVTGHSFLFCKGRNAQADRGKVLTQCGDDWRSNSAQLTQSLP